MTFVDVEKIANLSDEPAGHVTEKSSLCPAVFRPV
jgi:hypothetical protein